MKLYTRPALARFRRMLRAKPAYPSNWKGQTSPSTKQKVDKII
jgi:hypothetical protein